MAITAKFQADYSSFVGETTKAETHLKSLEGEANKVASSLNNVSNSGTASLQKLAGATTQANAGMADMVVSVGNLASAFGIGFGISTLIDIGQAAIADADALVKLSDK